MSEMQDDFVAVKGFWGNGVSFWVLKMEGFIIETFVCAGS